MLKIKKKIRLRYDKCRFGGVMRCLIDQRFRVIVMERMKLKKH